MSSHSPLLFLLEVPVIALRHRRLRHGQCLSERFAPFEGMEMSLRMSFASFDGMKMALLLPVHATPATHWNLTVEPSPWW